MKIKDRALFLKYALPCASTLVKRGNVSQDYIDYLIALVSEGKLPKENAEAIFKIAIAMCDNVATRMKKKSVDTDVIRRYFLLEHSKVVDDRFKLMGDFNPVDCNTYLGTVEEVGSNSATVKTILGKRKYKTVFCKSLKKGDKVVVHYDFIIERPPARFITGMSK